jgi:hypothetical protein
MTEILFGWFDHRSVDGHDLDAKETNEAAPRFLKRALCGPAPVNCKERSDVAIQRP